jgi:hypothetical protein
LPDWNYDPRDTKNYAFYRTFIADDEEKPSRVEPRRPGAAVAIGIIIVLLIIAVALGRL